MDYMEFGKALIIGVGINDLNESPTSTHIFADVVLIHNAADGLHPLLYQLKNGILPSNDLFDLTSHSLHLPNEAFMMVGSVISINKNKKQIFLKDKNDLSQEKTVTYKHLIISSSKHPGLPKEDDEFSLALQALIDAQKVRKNISKVLNTDALETNPHSSARKLLNSFLSRAKKKENSSVDEIAHHNIPQENKGNANILTSDKRLYEVQL